MKAYIKVWKKKKIEEEEERPLAASKSSSSALVEAQAMLQPPIVDAAPPSPALTSSTSAPSIFSALTSPVAVPPPAALSVSSKSPAEKGPKERSESVAKSIGSSVEASNPKKKAKPKKKKKKYAYDPYMGDARATFSNSEDVLSEEIDIEASSGTSDAESKSSSDDGDEHSEDENKKKDWAALRTEKWIANEKARKARKRRKIKEKAKELHKQHVANENKKDPTWSPEMELDVLQAGFKKLILIEKKKVININCF